MNVIGLVVVKVHASSGWLNAVQPKNMRLNVCPLVGVHVRTDDELKAVHPSNMDVKLVAEETFKLMLEVSEVQSLNMELKLRLDDVFQFKL